MKNLNSIILRLKKENIFLLKQQKEIKQYAESEVNKLMPFKHKSIVLEDKNKELVNEINMIKRVKQSGK